MNVPMEKTVESAYDIVKLSRKMYLPAGSVLINLLTFSPLKIYHDIAQDVQRNNQFYYMNKGLPDNVERDIIQNGAVTMSSKYHLIMQFPAAEAKFGSNPYRFSKKSIWDIMSSLLVAKGAYYKNEMNHNFMHLISGGIIEHIRDSKVPHKYLTEEAVDLKLIPFELKHVYGAMMLLLTGLALSTTAFLIEMGKGTAKEFKRITMKFIKITKEFKEIAMVKFKGIAKEFKRIAKEIKGIVKRIRSNELILKIKRVLKHSKSFICKIISQLK